MARKASARPSIAVFGEQSDLSLLDLIDHVLNQGVWLSGDVVLGLADVDLIYLRLEALLSTADRVLTAGRRPRRRQARRR